jgi:hypothetical protein
MYKYKVQVKKVSGRLNESVLPSKNLVVKSKTKKSKSAVLSEASKFFKKKYGLVIESADVESFNEIIDIFSEQYENYYYMVDKSEVDETLWGECWEEVTSKIVEFLDANPSVIKKMEGMDDFTKGEYAAKILEKTKLGVRIEEMVETLERFR